MENNEGFFFKGAAHASYIRPLYQNKNLRKTKTVSKQKLTMKLERPTEFLHEDN